MAKLRADAGWSMREVVRRGKPSLYDPTVIWKLEHGKPVRAKTLGSVLRALGYQERDDQYIQAFALWSTEQAKTLPYARVDSGMARVLKGKDRALATMMAAVRKIPEDDWPIVLTALENPNALKLWVRSSELMPK